ncbi:unnamed protein product [Lampetra fluviatilis]
MAAGTATARNGSCFLMEEAHLMLQLRLARPHRGRMPHRARTARRTLIIIHPANLRSSQPEGESRRTKHPLFTVTSGILITDRFEFMRRCIWTQGQ